MKCFALFLSLFAAANALTIGHHARHSPRHNVIAARVAEAQPIATAQVLPSIYKRAPRRRCKAPSSSLALTSTSAPASTSTPADTPSPPAVNAAPIPSSSSKPQEQPKPTSQAPKPSSVQVEAPKPTPSPAPAPSQPETPSSETFSGDGTFYDTGLGACGITNKDTDFIVAVSTTLFDGFPGATANPNKNPICNRKIRASRGGKSVDVIVTDRCGGCKYRDLDFSPSAFNVLGDPSEGRIKITWQWL